MQTVIPFPNEELLAIARRCDAIYVCPKDGNQRKGPLVVYAGKDTLGRNFVGDIYFNFRRIEQHQHAVEAFTNIAKTKLRKNDLLDTFDTIVAIPQGGRTFGQMLAFVTNKRFTYADKKPIPTEAGKKQEYVWDLSQFEFEKGERVAVVEDVFNNFQNTDSTLEQIVMTGAHVVLLVGALNRSPIFSEVYIPKQGPYKDWSIPIVASIRKSYPEYKQDDPEVAEDIAKGNLELEVKKNWARLRAISENNNN